ncbi:MAG: hypothetical protein IH914_10465 [candidate division Zixibacteria bacterium]|nr:hypothetical protein [candidate division Zixibacteria bacterium]
MNTEHTKLVGNMESRNRVSRNRVMRSVSHNKRVLNPTIIFAAAIALVLGAPTSANAFEVGLLLTVPALINELLLLVSVIAVFVALKVYQLVKGGLLAKSWQFFFIGLICLALAQFITFSGNAGLFAAPEVAQPLLLLVMGAFWLYGALKAKQALG